MVIFCFFFIIIIVGPGPWRASSWKGGSRGEEGEGEGGEGGAAEFVREGLLRTVRLHHDVVY